MHILVGILSAFLIVGVLWDAFETIVLPRRVTRRFRFARLYFSIIWGMWSYSARRLPHRREGYLSLYGPLSLLGLLMSWAIALIFGFGVVQWALGSHLHNAGAPASFSTDLYMSGTTFFTLGLGDVTPTAASARLFTVLECGVGFGFLALVISYLPVLYQAFSRREASVSLLDARAGSPPTAAEMLVRGGHGEPGAHDDSLLRLLREWEQWSADLLESHLSYPILAYFRSQHDNQSWVAALSSVLDTCSLVLAGLDGIPAQRQARLTFAIARHAAVDLAQVLNVPRARHPTDRLSSDELARLRERLRSHGISLCESEAATTKFEHLRRLYEPTLQNLAEHLLMDLPPWVAQEGAKDDWQSEPGDAERVLPAI
jgi:hypothetical protein